MNQEQLYADESIEIKYDPVNQWIYVDWKGYLSVHEVQKSCNQILKYFREKQAHKLLNDNTHVSGIWWDASEWIAEQWFPEMLEAGLKYVAWVYSGSQFSVMSAEKTRQRIAKTMRYRFEEGQISEEDLLSLHEMAQDFHTLEAAQEWLSQY